MSNTKCVTNTQQSAVGFKALSGWPANSCWANCSHNLTRPPLKHLLLGSPSGLFNGPQSAGEVEKLGVKEGVKSDTGGLCLVLGRFKWALESGGYVGV